jgi:hypothetical protein
MQPGHMTYLVYGGNCTLLRNRIPTSITYKGSNAGTRSRNSGNGHRFIDNDLFICLILAAKV